MLSNVEAVDALRGLARIKSQDYETKTVHPLLEGEAIAEGWSVEGKNKKTIRLKRAKAHGVLLEDRVWSLLYRMGFADLSGPGGAFLKIDPKDPKSPITQIDVVGIDKETAVAIECKSAERPSKRPQFQEELGKHALIRQRFVTSVNQQFAAPFKRQAALAMFTSNIILLDNDRKRAQEANVVLFDEQDLTYYEDLVSHLGPAARYQFLADMLPGKPVPGLAIRVPAIRAKIGGYNCYTFSVAPDYLLKIAYVSHRAKGKASDVDTYQRMIRKSRLKKIRTYIEENGIFPTNIVINLNKKPTFERREQETDQEAGVMGWLDIRPSYKSAWIIDGQHRLFAYSGLAKAAKARLSILAFESLPPSTQAELFIDINAEQKSVKQSLLQELYAELHWNATDPSIRVRAIVAKAIKSLDADPESAFYQRILASDDKRDAVRCISLTSVFRALDNSEFYVAPTKKEGIVDYGPLWAGDDSEATRRRTVYVLRSWFALIRASAPDWWDAGSGDGGGLAMNDGVTACINVLRSVFQHLAADGEKLVMLDDEDLFGRVTVYGTALGSYLGSLSMEERMRLRALRGVQGQTTWTRRCQQAIHERFPSFAPAGLAQFMETEKAQTNTKAKAIVDRIESTLQKTVLEELKREYGLDEEQWWFTGVPKAIRVKVTQRYQEDDGKRGSMEYYFDLLDYRHILLQNWGIFNELLGYGKANSSKDKRTAWINDVNEMRRIVSHVSAGRSVSLEELAQLESYDAWLDAQIAGYGASDGERSVDSEG